jgi:eukaryotic-like serine/threonine-protein kinase
MPLSNGTQLGPYKILAPIGAGGMGDVYKARDTRLDRTVAIKVSKDQFSERFEREARAVAALNHPNICTLHDVGPNYLVMEMVEGVPLKGPLPLEKAVEYAGQILDALGAAHRKGITHRDLKPANILVTKQGIKLLDFGLARQTGPLKESDATLTDALTGKEQIVGTLQYMAPEQLQGKDADARSDLFSFGCVLYEMLTGKRAFAGESKASVIAAILEREPAPLGMTPPLDRIVRRTLAKDPDQRFQTARDLKAALTWALDQPPAPAPAKPGRLRWIAAAILLICVFLGGWGVARFHQPPAEARPYRLEINPPEGSRFIFGSGVGGLALSPDGRTAAFVASGSGMSGLWIRPLDGAAARPIAGTEGAAYPFWSPDGKSVAFFSAGKLQRIDLAGGAPLAICDVASSRGGAWNSDGRILYGGGADSLFQVPASGGTPSRLTTLEAARGEGYHRWPHALPGGRFLFSVRSDKPENTGIYAASFAKPGERKRLLTTDTNALYAPGGDGKSYLLWLRGGTLVAQQLDTGTLTLVGEPHAVADPVASIGVLGVMNVAASAGGLLLYSASNTLSQFTWLDRTGKPLGVVGEPGEYSIFRVSPDGRRVAASLDRPGSTDLWLLDMERGVSGRFTYNRGLTTYPIWSPDGRTILYSTGIPRNLFHKESSGAGNEQRLSQSPRNQIATDWSRDGRWVLYSEVTPGSQRDLWVLPVTADGKPAPNSTPRPYLRTPSNEWWGRFSTEAPPRWVAYQSDDTGRWEVYIQAFPEPRGATQISTGGGQYPQWGAGARELFYVSLDNKLMAVSLKMGADTVGPSTPRELFALPAVDAGWNPYDTAPDGQRFLVRATPGQAAQPLTVIVNWPALLKREAPAP